MTRPKSIKSIKKELQRQEEEERKDVNASNVTDQPGRGQLTQYNSVAEDFWKKRECKGLEANGGKDEAKASHYLGQIGIASDYGK